MKLFIIRHGDPDYDNDTLTERGWQEAELLKERLLRDNITKVYCSPKGRAQATAKPFLEATGLTSVTCDFLREFLVAVVENGREKPAWCLSPEFYEKNRRQLEDREDWFNNEIYQRYDLISHERRVLESFDNLLAENGYTREGSLYNVAPGTDTEQNIAIFCHAGLGLLLLSHIADIPTSIMWQMFKIQPTGVSTVIFSGREKAHANIFGVGDMTHLASVGLTYKG